MDVVTVRFHGDETLQCDGMELSDASMLDYWRWAYGDLMDNVYRGVFAEWMVAKLLGMTDQLPRPPFWPWDIESEGGVRVEVKASAYLQSFRDPAMEVRAETGKIVFSHLKTKLPLDPYGRRVAEDFTFNADLYVFCVETCVDESRWQPLNLEQWEFYLVTRRTLLRLDQKGMNLSRLRTLASPLTATEFVKTATRMLAELGDSPDVKGRKEN